MYCTNYIKLPPQAETGEFTCHIGCFISTVHHRTKMYIYSGKISKFPVQGVQSQGPVNLTLASRDEHCCAHDAARLSRSKKTVVVHGMMST